MLAAGGVASLAGCQGSTDDSGDGNGGNSGSDSGGNNGGTTSSGNAENVDGATLKTYMEWLTSAPELTWNPYYYRSQWPRLVYPLAMDRKASLHETNGKLIPMAAKEWSIADDGTSWSLTFADGNWSDGIPVQGKDFGMETLLARWATEPTPTEIKKSGEGPRTAFEAITDITWDGKKVTVHSEPGWFNDFYMESVVQSTLIHAGASCITTQAKAHWQELYDTVKDNPWSQETRDRVTTFTEKKLEWVPDDPTSDEEVPVTGPFKLSEVREDSVILEKNPEFRLADAINWDRVEVSSMAESRARFQALQSNNLDMTTGLLGAPSAQLIKALPDNIKRHQHTLGPMSGLLLNGLKLEPLGDDRVRRAIEYALNKPRISRVANKYTSQAPPDPPGLMFPEAKQWVPKDLWSTYNQYTYDTDKAASLMEAAGLEREDGTWMYNGQPLSIPYLTGTQDLGVQQVIKNQLGEFGIQIDLNTQSDTIVQNRTDKGDFVMTDGVWPGGTPLGIYIRALQQSTRRHLFNVWSDEEVLKWVNSHDNIINKKYDWTMNVEGFTADQLKRWTVSAPPVGKPDSNKRVEYPVVYYDFIWGQNLPDSKRTKIMQELTWAFNWNLPLVVYSQVNQIAFQDHEQWNAPEDSDIWRQYGAQHRLLKQGHIQANPDAW